MKQVYTFHKTVRGHLHIINEFPCEDSSASFSAENNKYHIAIVADGHGSSSCFRSDVGSKIVTDVALDCLRKFAEVILVSQDSENKFYKDMFSNLRYRQITLRRLTDIIIANWNDCILEHYTKNPLDLKEMENSEDNYQDGNNIAHIYGTTLIAALMLPSCLILLHQGDGRCDVFFDDGTIEQPIPWDDRCVDTAVTSLCDEDVVESFRTSVINMTEKNVIACYLGCDGVEDAYRDTYESLEGSHILMGGVHTFYKDLTCQIAIKDTTEFEKYLDMMLPEFSANGLFSHSGSGDDVSIAGIVDIEAIQQFVEPFQLDVKWYALEEELFWKEDELRGKTRKHDILQKRIHETETELKEKVNTSRLLETQIKQLDAEYLELKEKVIQTKKEIDEYSKDSESVRGYLKGTNKELLLDGKRILKMATQTVKDLWYNESFMECKKRQKEYNLLYEKLQDLDNKINNMKKEHSECIENIHILEKNFKNAKSEFADYDAKFQIINEEKIRILTEIAALPIVKNETGNVLKQHKN